MAQYVPVTQAEKSSSSSESEGIGSLESSEEDLPRCPSRPSQSLPASDPYASQICLLDSGVSPLPKKALIFGGSFGGEWNSRFQNLLEASRIAKVGKEVIEIYEGLASVVRDFIHVASHYGAIIVSEQHMPMEKKTVQPWKVGGVAGGVKYRAQDILFKFAADVPIRTNEWIYGENGKPSDERAMKAAGT